MAGPLVGIRVIDLSAVVVGPACSLVLAELGADVIKVEPIGGEILRQHGIGKSPGMTPRFLQLNHNKRAISLDLKSDEGRNALLKVLETVDVFVSNMRPNAILKLGLDYRTLQPLFPRLVHCMILGYGSQGPYSGRAGYDIMFQSLSGLAGTFAAAGEPPQFVRMSIIDQVAGGIAARCILAGLFRRERKGHGESIEVPMFENFAELVMSEHLDGHVFTSTVGPVGDKALLKSNNHLLPTADGYLVVGAHNAAQTLSLFKAIGRAELSNDPRFSTVQSRIASLGAIREILEEVLPTRTTSEWVNIFLEHDVPVAGYNSLDGVLTDPHLEAVGFWKIEEHPTEGPLRRVQSQNRFSGGMTEAYLPVPKAGAHSIQVLKEAGMSEAEIDKLVAQGVVADGRQQ